MMDLVNEKREERDQEETNKMLEIIHRQAKWRNMEEENKRMMACIDKELKKPTKKDKIKEVVLNGIANTLLLLTTVAGLATWSLVFYLIAH